MSLTLSRRVSLLALLLCAAAPAACAVDTGSSSSPETVSSAKQAVTAAPAHEWLFTESSGTTTADAVATGAVTGNLGPSASLGGGKVTLSPNGPYDPNAYVDFGTTADAFGTNDFTVTTWYQTTFGGGLGDVLGNRTDSSGGQFLSARINGGGQVTFEVDDNSDGSTYVAAGTNVSVNDGAWHHLAFVRQGGTITIYVDGTASGSASSLSGQPAEVADSGSSPFRIGRSLPNCCSNFLTVAASYEDLRIYNSALAPSDISGIVSQSGPGSCAFGTYDCSGNPVNGCTSTVPCATGGACDQGSGCASGVCSGGTCQAVLAWQCTDNCWSINTACRDAQGATLNACITACGDDPTCLDGCDATYATAYAQCDTTEAPCEAVCNGSCSDGTQDDGETGVDCGGPCAACP